jgi:hypothetical protein
MKDKTACKGLLDRGFELMDDVEWQMLPIAHRKEFVKTLRHLWEQYKRAK